MHLSASDLEDKIMKAEKDLVIIKGWLVLCNKFCITPLLVATELTIRQKR
jgi:hypothetical protein